MSLNLGYPIWNSNSEISCELKAPIVCNVNARPAYILPTKFDGVSEWQWILHDNVTEYPDSTTGARNGIAVDINGVTYLWDVLGVASSGDPDANSPFNKLAAFLELCKNCDDCTTTGVATLAGEYEGVFPALPATTFCYKVEVSGYTSEPTARDIQIVEMNCGTYLVGEVSVVSYAAGTATYNVCLTKDVTSNGSPIGFPSNYTFMAV
jgi:hypothetical protein